MSHENYLAISISNLTCQNCLLINWLLAKRKGILKILIPVSFVERDFKRPCFIYSNMFQLHFYKEMKVIFFSFLSSRPAFLSRPEFHINNSSRRRYTVEYLFRLFHETKFNARFIIFNLIQWNVYKINEKANLYELLQYGIGYIFFKKLQSKKTKSKRSVWVMSWLKNRLETSEFNNILNLLKTEKNIGLLSAIT